LIVERFPHILTKIQFWLKCDNNDGCGGGGDDDDDKHFM